MEKQKREYDRQITEVISDLYANNGKKLRGLCQKEMSKFGGIYQMDYDDFYSKAGYEITLARDTYDPKKDKSFSEYVTAVIRNAVHKEVTYRNRKKRKTSIEVEETGENGEKNIKTEYISNVPLDAPIEEDGDSLTTLCDLLPGAEDVESEIFTFQDERVEEFMAKLSSTQKQILEMKMDGYSVPEIQEKLGLSDKQYEWQFNDLKKFENVQALFRNKYYVKVEEDEETMSGLDNQTKENCKSDKITITSMLKQMNSGMIRFDYELQRGSNQWTTLMKGNLISDILQGNRLNPLIFAEQIINGVSVNWDIDGKQRCTVVHEFVNNNFKISKNVRRGIIHYQTYTKDENGFPIAHNEEFDIRGKKFKDLPEELKEKFYDYTFNYDQYLNCSEEDIAYHIERYNDGKPMNVTQKGLTKLGAEFAGKVISISQMHFFKEGNGYKIGEFKNGKINRVILESIMAAYYRNDWKKDLGDMCRFLKINATMDDFDNFEDLVTQLDNVATDDIREMFDSTDSFLYFGLFAQFQKTGLETQRFVDFMNAFRLKEIDTKEYEDTCVNPKTGKKYGTKDAYIVANKMDALLHMMNMYLHIEDEDQSGVDGEKNDADHDCIEDVESFIAQNVELKKDDVHEDMECYEETLNDLTDKTVRYDSDLLEDENRPSLLAMVAYSFKNDVDLDSWMEDFASRTSSYLKNQCKNYAFMVHDLLNYQKQHSQKVGMAC